MRTERSKEAAERSREAREYLLEYRSAKREAADMELRLTQLRLKYALPKAIQYSTMPSAHDHNRDLSDYMAAFEELEDYLIKKHTNCIGKEVDIYMRLDMMEDELEREVLKFRYIDLTPENKLRSWKSVANKMNYDISTVVRIHGRALLNFPLD